LNARYEEGKRRLSHLLTQTTGFAITTDGWSNLNLQQFTTFTIHFISSNWDYHSFVLSTIRLPRDTTASSITEGIQETFKKWNLNLEKCQFIVTDNGSNYLAACKQLNIRNIPCMAHTLQLSLDEVFEMEEIKLLISKCNLIVTHFRKSFKKTNLFFTIQKQLGREVPLKLKKSTKTRWGSTYLMMERINDTNDALDLYFKKNVKKPSDFQLSDHELHLLQDLLLLLAPVDYSTLVASEESIPTLSMVFPVVIQLQLALSQVSITDSTIIEARKKLLENLKERWSAGKNVYSMLASICDPRFKDLSFVNSKNARDSTKKMFKDFVSATKPAENNPEVSQELPPKKRIKDTFWETFDAPSTTTEELTQYLSRVQIPRQSNPLSWWRDSSHLFPRVAAVVRTLLCAPATSVPSERIFSLAGEVFSKKRCRLGAEKANKMIFLKKNQKLWQMDI